MKAQDDVMSERVIKLQDIIQGLQIEVQRLNDAQVDCENTMRCKAADWSAREETYKTSVKKLQGEIDKLKVEKEEEAKRTIALEKSTVQRDATISALQARIKDLELSLVQAHHPTDVTEDPSAVVPAESIPQRPESQVTPQPTSSVMPPIKVPPPVRLKCFILTLVHQDHGITGRFKARHG